MPTPTGHRKWGFLARCIPFGPTPPCSHTQGAESPVSKSPPPHTHATHCCMKKKPHLLDLGTISCMVVAEGGAKLPVIKKKTKSICFSLHQTSFNPKYFNLPLGFILPCAWQRGLDGRAGLVLGCSLPPPWKYSAGKPFLSGAVWWSGGAKTSQLTGSRLGWHRWFASGHP